MTLSTFLGAVAVAALIVGSIVAIVLGLGATAGAAIDVRRKKPRRTTAPWRGRQTW